MKQSVFIKIFSIVSLFSGILSAFFSGMFIAAGTLHSVASVFMLISTVVFACSVTFYILLSK